MKRKVPVLGIVYNVVSLASIPILIGGAIAGSEPIMYLGIAMIVPTIFWPERPSYRAYWKRFEE